MTLLKTIGLYLAGVGVLFVNIVLTWQKVGDNQVTIKALQDQVARQYQVQREMNDKTNSEVDKLKLEAAYLKGYQQAQKDLSTFSKK